VPADHALGLGEQLAGRVARAELRPYVVKDLVVEAEQRAVELRDYQVLVISRSPSAR
jgi:hypothetical protein